MGGDLSVRVMMNNAILVNNRWQPACGCGWPVGICVRAEVSLDLFS